LIKVRLYEILEKSRPENKISYYIDIFLIVLIILNLVAVVLETVSSIYLVYSTLFNYFELFSIFVFTIEYLARVWSCVIDEQYRNPVYGRLRYMRSFYAIIDLLAILPFYLAFLGLDLRILRALRIFRFLRFAKLARYSKSLQLLVKVITEKRGELVATIIIMFVLLLFASASMYYLENQIQPDKFSSIPAAMWWGVETLTTVGYGDMLPVTNLGKTVAAFIAILGIGMFALPAGILGSAFVEVMAKEKNNACPHCGKNINDKLNKDNGESDV